MLKTSIQSYCDALTSEFETISVDRCLVLEKLSQYICSKQQARQPVHLVYICTHNSRRSHFGQIWAQVAAYYYGIKHLLAYSGGTEATAFNQNAINTVKRIGFEVIQKTGTNNPVYQLLYSTNETAIECFSKTYDDDRNPKSGFAAIMTCSDAEENCPFIPGVDVRIGTTYDDPKVFDNTPLQDAKYDERCRQIALETLYVFSKVKMG